MFASASNRVCSNTASPHKAGAPSRIRLLALLLAVTTAAVTLTAEPGVRILKGNNQEAVYGSSFAAPLTVWVADATTHRSIAGMQVTFTASAGIGLSSTSAVTDERGLAAVTATALAAGVSNVRVQVAGHPASQVTFGNLAVDKAVLTVLPADVDAPVGAALPAVSAYSIQGFVNGDTEATAQISGTPVLTTTAKDNSPRANYAIKGGVGTLAAPNYSFVAGFGTLAFLGAPEMEKAAIQQAELTGKSAEIHAALADQPIAVPAFLAGLRGESGVFVQTAIWQSQPVHSAILQTSSVRKAMAPKLAADGPMAAVPVRPAVAAKLVAPSAAKIPAHATVRSAALVSPTAQTVLSSSSVSVIRKAFNPPGTN
jgi:hypothetical protein